LFPALLLLSSAVDGFPFQAIQSRQFTDSSLALVGLVIIEFLYRLFFFNATGQETGWRGFALPRLQTRTSPLVAALVIALFWAPIHLLAWQADGEPVMTVQFWVEMYIGTILLSVLIVWLCNCAHGSILVAGITYAAANTAMAVIPAGDSLLLILPLTTLGIILVGRMWKTLPRDHPAVYRSPEHAAPPGVEPASTLAP
jgi:membrane protease YdiL (CAAX protease family)